MIPISVISRVSIILIFFSYGIKYPSQCSKPESIADTLFVLYHNIDQNQITKSSRIHPSEREYPKDWGRSYHVINENVHIWFIYHNDLPGWSDMVFEYRSVEKEYIDNHDFKDQEWFRKTSKEEIYNTFLGEGKVVYLVEKDRIRNGKAVMIRVYPNTPTVE